MILNIYSGLFRVVLALLGVVIAVSIIYYIITHGATPLIDTQTGGYETMVKGSSDEIITMIETSGAFD